MSGTRKVSSRRFVAALGLVPALLLTWAGAGSTVRAESDASDEEASAGDSYSEEGIVARFGSVTASFRFFGDTGAAYERFSGPNARTNTSFLAGSFDFFSSVRLSDHLQTLAEIVAEFEGDTNEVGFEMERLWGQWSQNDAFYAKLGREHSPVNHWNRRYHHGRILWPAASQPFLARFEDQGGPLPIHQSGVEVGGTLHSRAGGWGYVAVVSNGRGFSQGEVTNVADRNDSKALDAGMSFVPSGAPGLVFGGNYHWDKISADPAAGPAGTDMHETIATLFGEFRGERWEVLSEAGQIDHDPVPGGPSFTNRSAYLQINYRRTGWQPYARVDAQWMALGDPFYTGAGLDLDRWQGLAGGRLDLGEHAAFKVEAGGGRGQERDAAGVVSSGNFAAATIALQWVF